MKRFVVLMLIAKASFAGFEPCANQVDYADGKRLKWGDQYFYHSGQQLAWNSSVHYPDGGHFVWANRVAYPNGQSLKNGNFTYYPNGQVMEMMDSTYYPSGRHLAWANNVYYENGNPARLGGRFYLPNGTLTNGPISIRVPVVPYGELAAYIFEYSEVYKLRLNALINDPYVRVKEINLDPNFSYELEIETGHSGLKMLLSGDVNGVLFCSMSIE